LEHLALFALGLALLVLGEPLLVFGAARLDRAIGRSPFAVGIVAVAFGPCLAGLAFDLAAVMQPAPGALPRLAVGHIIGSNIASLGLVLGVASLVRPVAATAKLFYTAIPLALGAVLLFWFLARNAPQLPLSRVDAGFLLAAFMVSMVLLIRAAKQEFESAKAEFASWVPERMRLWLAAVFALAGLAALVGGALLSASEAIRAAIYLKASSLKLGTTVAAFGTALPPLVAAIIAARQGRSNLVLGIVLGSVLFNMLLTVGVVAMAHPPIVENDAIMKAIPAMAGFTLLLLPVLLNGLQVPRWEGAILLAAYIGFMVWQLAPR